MKLDTPLTLERPQHGAMERFVQFCMLAGFVVALLAVSQRTWGALPAVYALGILLTGIFALWGIRRHRR